MKSLRILIVEDDPELMDRLKLEYQAIFKSQGYEGITVETAATVRESRELARSAQEHVYDFVSLDINLGDTTLTGLDVLKSFERFHSAWMVVLLTGVETDPSLDDTVGEKKADLLRTQLRKDAFERFPPERLIVVEKPSSRLPEDEASLLLSNRLGQIALTYQHISRQRYIFKPINVKSVMRVPAPKGKKAKRRFIDTRSRHWQIRFNCGEIRTLPDKAGFQTIHHLLKYGREQPMTPEEALVVEPRQEKAKVESHSNGDPIAAYFISRGISWPELAEEEQTLLIRAKFGDDFTRYAELRQYEDDEDLSANEADELEDIIKKHDPLIQYAEVGYQRLKQYNQDDDNKTDGLTQAEVFQVGLNISPSANASHEKTGARVDSPEAKNFRARWKRAKDYLRENGFADFAQHLEDYVQSTGASWSYNPPEEFEWTT